MSMQQKIHNNSLQIKIKITKFTKVYRQKVNVGKLISLLYPSNKQRMKSEKKLS